MSAIDKDKDLADFKAAYTLDELDCTTTVGKCEEWIKKGCGVKDYMHVAGEINANYPRICPAEALPDLAGHNSFVTDEIKKNPDVFDQLKDKKTAGGVSLSDCIKTGIDNKGHPNIKPVGMVAGDEESYTLFAALFDPVIDARHGGFPADAKHVSDMNTDNIVKTDMDPSGEYVKTSRVRTGRSVRGFNLPPCNSFEERRKLEKAIVDALMTLKGDLAGSYFPLHGSNSNPCGDMAEGMTHDKEKDLLSRGNLFQEPDSTLLLSGGMGRHWPDARGIYHNEGQDLFVWLNEEDHMRIVSMQKGRDMAAVAARFMRACNEVEATGLKFMQNDHLGWILTCPSNLGTGLRAGCQVSLRELNLHLKDHTNPDLKWKKALAHMGLQARGVGGVDVVGTDVFDISNADRLGKADTSLINFCINGVTLLVRCEHALRQQGDAAKELVDKALGEACGLGSSVSATTSKGADGMGNGYEILMKAADMLPPTVAKAAGRGMFEKKIHAGAAHGPPDPRMSPAAMKYLLTRPKVPAPLDPNFSPLVLGKKKYMVYASGSPYKLEWALERSGGLCGRDSLPVFADNHPEVDASLHLAGMLIQTMLWERSGFRLWLSGPPKMCEALAKAYSPEGKFAYEVKTMPKVCGTPDTPFEVKIAAKPDDMPAAKDVPIICGKNANGCRLAFDLGKSDVKTVAVKDNEVLESKETEWDVTNPDPEYHWGVILKAMKETASKLPRVDAIGGSATGTVGPNNEATWCDIFPNVPPDVYKEKVVNIFQRLAKEFGDVPLRVINDGEVTALAAIMKLGSGNVMGISMGSSEGGGYANEDGNLMGWINELCYVPIDLNPDAPTDPWQPHAGLSHVYLGQRGATKLAEKGGVDLPEELKFSNPAMQVMKHEPHAKCLKLIQAAMKDPKKEPQARKIYETVGVYLGYQIALYCEHYKLDHLMIMGRVSSGEGGQIMLDKAKEVIAKEFPEYQHIQFHTPDEHFKRVGQCIAAAALPPLA